MKSLMSAIVSIQTKNMRKNYKYCRLEQANFEEVRGLRNFAVFSSLNL
jgi:hypothetical protein